MQRVNVGAHLVSLAVLLALVSPDAGKIIYVDDDAAGPNDGSSWANAYVYLQDALYSASAGDEVRVAQGTYRPDQGWRSDGDPEFRPRNGCTLLGGYAGVGQPDPNDRDPERYKTVLSGDINGDDVEPDNTQALIDEPSRADNLREVVYTTFTDKSLILDGFIITGGTSHGMVTYDSRCRISNCVFIHNSSDSYGGAIRTEGHNGTGPTITHCRFINNCAAKAGGAVLNSCTTTFAECDFIGNAAEYGGALSNSGDVELIDCTFEGNVAETGGALHESASGILTVTGCCFFGNHARHGPNGPVTQIKGGAISVYGSSLREEDTIVMTDCVFQANSATFTGGAIATEWVPAAVSGCIFAGNQAGYGGGAAFCACDCLEFDACVLVGNSAGRRGGAIHTLSRPSQETEFNFLVTLRLNGCTLTDNAAAVGQAIACEFDPTWGTIRNSLARTDAVISRESNGSEDPGSVRISNCIIKNGGNEIHNPGGLGITITYTNLRGGVSSIDDPCNAVVWGEGNIDVDPRFIQPGYWDPNGTADDPNDDFWVDGDYHLKSQAGRRDPSTCSWVKDDATSLCIDAGNMNSPVGHEPFPNGGIANMGAYGGTAEASKSYFGEPVCETIVAGDIDGDCKIDFGDFRLMALHWLEEH